MDSRFARVFRSDITAIGALTEFSLAIGKPGLVHWFAGVEFFSDLAGTPATPTAGDLVFTAATMELPDLFQAMANGAVDLAVTNASVDWAGPTVAVKVGGLDTVAGATHFRLNISGYRS